MIMETDYPSSFPQQSVNKTTERHYCIIHYDDNVTRFKTIKDARNALEDDDIMIYSEEITRIEIKERNFIQKVRR